MNKYTSPAITRGNSYFMIAAVTKSLGDPSKRPFPTVLIKGDKIVMPGAAGLEPCID